MRECTIHSICILPSDLWFLSSDIKLRVLKCEKCSEYNYMEDTFPDCLITFREQVIRACQKCKNGLTPSIGKWIAKKHSITDKRDYHHRQLFSHFISPADVLYQFRRTNNLTDFFNLKIGIAYVEAKHRIGVHTDFRS